MTNLQNSNSQSTESMLPAVLDAASLRQYQKSLIYMGLEDTSASEMLPQIQGGRDVNEAAWQIDVARFIRLALEKEFVKIKPAFEFFDDGAEPCVVEAVYLSTPVSNDVLWMGVQFTSTKRLIDLLASEKLDSWSAIDAPLSSRLMKEFIG